jgi:predicted dehydrogenase
VGGRGEHCAPVNTGAMGVFAIFQSPLHGAQNETYPMAVGIILVGVGSWGVDWATNIFPQVANARLVGIVCRHPHRKDDLAHQCDRPKEVVFGSLKEAMSETSADAVLIATQTSSHAEIAEEALQAGLHVLVEKPFAETVQQACSLVQRAKERARVLMVSQNYRFFPAARLAAIMVRENRLGQVHRVSIDFRRNARSTDPTRASWLERQNQPLLLDLGIHHFDLIRMVTGLEACSAYCVTTTPGHSRFRDPSTASALISLENNVSVSWKGSWENAGGGTTYSGDWRIECERGDIVWACRGDRDASLDYDRLAIRSNKKCPQDP